MKAVTVIDVFHTSIGEIVILTFPDKEFPKIGMVLKNPEGATWKITGVGMGKSSDMTNSYKHFEPPVFLYDCKVEAQNIGRPLRKGESLTQARVIEFPHKMLFLY